MMADAYASGCTRAAGYGPGDGNRRPAHDQQGSEARVIRPGRGIAIPVEELEWRFSASSGPGGQHANTSNTKVEARLDLRTSPSLSDDVRERLVARLGPVVRVTCQTTRSQTRNRDLAVAELERRLAGALVRTTPRRPTKATRGSQRRRLEAKARRSQLKSQRRRPPAE
jgi:ribosome-associated protein